ncbi:hypothetical protein DFH09DRAFT_1370400 [Mycena vulgaris]|nr:hypothetical protein DFH09DRAFT_1370400 [Mycena vulgaris]
MSTSCISTATATTTSVVTVESVNVYWDLFLRLHVFPTATTLTSTIPGVVTTIQVPVVETVGVASSQTITLFGSVCTVIPTTSANASVSLSFSASISTPDPIVITAHSSTTLANGQISVVLETITSTQPPSVVLNNTDGSSPSNVGPIVGGVVGGFFILIGIALIVWFIMKRRRRWDDIFDKEDTDIAPPRKPRATKRFSLDADIEPKPYQYGLVGQSKSPPIGASPPSSPRAFSPSHPSPPGRQHTLTPLHLPMSASTPGPSATTMSSRPSTAGSMRPLRDAPVPPVSPPPLTHSHTTSSGSSTSVHVPALPSHWGHHSPSPSAGQEYFERSGSPTSVRDYEPQLRLQLANLGDDEVAQSLPTQGVLHEP